MQYPCALLRFNIRDNAKDSSYRIQYRDECGLKKTFKFRYNMLNQEEVFKKAEIKRQELINKYY